MLGVDLDGDLRVGEVVGDVVGVVRRVGDTVVGFILQLPLHALVAVQDFRRCDLAAVDPLEIVRQGQLFDGLGAGKRRQQDVCEDQEDDHV